MRQEVFEEIDKLTDRICSLTLAKDSDPKADVNRVIDSQVRSIRSQALLLRGCPQEFQAQSFRAWEGQEDE